MPKIHTPTVRPYHPGYTPLSTRRCVTLQNLSVVRNESVNQIAMPTALETMPQSFIGHMQDFQGRCHPPLQPTSVDCATNIAALTFSVEIADQIAGHLSGCLSEDIIKNFQEGLQPISDAKAVQKRIEKFIDIGWIYTAPVVIGQHRIPDLKPLLTSDELKQLAELTRKIIDAPGFLTRDRSQSDRFEWIREECNFSYPISSDTAERHKVIVVIFALICFAFRGDSPFVMAMAPLTSRCHAGRSSSIHKRLFFCYLDNKKQLEEAIEKGNFNLPVVRDWATRINDQNYRLEDTRNRMRVLEEEFRMLPPWQITAAPTKGIDTRSGTFKIVENDWYVLELPDASQPD